MLSYQVRLNSSFLNSNISVTAHVWTGEYCTDYITYTKINLLYKQKTDEQV